MTNDQSQPPEKRLGAPERVWIEIYRLGYPVPTEFYANPIPHSVEYVRADLLQQPASEPTFSAKHFRFGPCFHSMVKPDCPSCCQSHAIRLEGQLKKLEHSTALPVRERIEKALREHMRHCYAVYKGVPPTVDDWVGGALHYVMWGVEQDLPTTSERCGECGHDCGGDEQGCEAVVKENPLTCCGHKCVFPATGAQPNLGVDTPYPLSSTLAHMVEWLRHLHDDHECDCIGWEQRSFLIEAAERCQRKIAATGAGDEAAPAAPQDDGWVTFGRVKVDIENETETFERIHPPQPSTTTSSASEAARELALRIAEIHPPVVNGGWDGEQSELWVLKITGLISRELSDARANAIREAARWLREDAWEVQYSDGDGLVGVDPRGLPALADALQSLAEKKEGEDAL